MASQCDGCGDPVNIGGGISDFWSVTSGPTGGMTLELVDGSEHFLCHDCLGRLPDDSDLTAEDIADL
jgi:hypothetical protein